MCNLYKGDWKKKINWIKLISDSNCFNNLFMDSSFFNFMALVISNEMNDIQSSKIIFFVYK